MLKKILKILLTILVILALVTGAVAIWQWDNIQSVLLGIREDAENIEKLRNENQEKLVKDVNNAMDTPLRDMTEEEKELIETGAATNSEVYQKMFEEKAESEAKTDSGKEKAEVQIPAKNNEGKNNTAAQNTPSVGNKPTKTKDEIISGAMAELYKIQNEFNAKAEATIKQGDSYYMSIRKHPQDAEARAQTIAHFTPIVRGIESQCDAKVEAVIKKLESDLISIGADTSIIGTIRTTYANEKQHKLSYYSNKYLK